MQQFFNNNNINSILRHINNNNNNINNSLAFWPNYWIELLVIIYIKTKTKNKKQKTTQQTIKTNFNCFFFKINMMLDKVIKINQGIDEPRADYINISVWKSNSA